MSSISPLRDRTRSLRYGCRALVSGTATVTLTAVAAISLPGAVSATGSERPDTGSLTVVQRVVPRSNEGEDVTGSVPTGEGRRFDADTTVSGVEGIPGSRTTTGDGTGSVHFVLVHPRGTAAAPITVTGAPRSGYGPVTQGGANAVCADLSTAGESLPVTNDDSVPGRPGFTVEVPAGASVTCTVYRRQEAADVRVGELAEQSEQTAEVPRPSGPSEQPMPSESPDPAPPSGPLEVPEPSEPPPPPEPSGLPEPSDPAPPWDRTPSEEPTDESPAPSGPPPSSSERPSPGPVSPEPAPSPAPPSSERPLPSAEPAPSRPWSPAEPSSSEPSWSEPQPSERPLPSPAPMPPVPPDDRIGAPDLGEGAPGASDLEPVGDTGREGQRPQRPLALTGPSVGFGISGALFLTGLGLAAVLIARERRQARIRRGDS